MAATIVSFEAKTHLYSLLERVSKGETITITEHGKPVARLVPFQADTKPDVRRIIEEMLEYRDRQNRTLGEVGARALVAEGRRY